MTLSSHLTGGSRSLALTSLLHNSGGDPEVGDTRSGHIHNLTAKVLFLSCNVLRGMRSNQQIAEIEECGFNLGLIVISFNFE